MFKNGFSFAAGAAVFVLLACCCGGALFLRGCDSFNREFEKNLKVEVQKDKDRRAVESDNLAAELNQMWADDVRSAAGGRNVILDMEGDGVMSAGTIAVGQDGRLGYLIDARYLVITLTPTTGAEPVLLDYDPPSGTVTIPTGQYRVSIDGKGNYEQKWRVALFR